MEVRTKPVDRLLDALSPVLAAELDRVVKETQEALELEFQTRIQSAVQEVRCQTEQAADVRLQEVLAETREAVRKQVTEELESRFEKILDETAKNLHVEWSGERDRLQAQVEQWRTFSETQRQLAEATSQAEILARFLRLAEPFAGGLAVYVSKADGLALWKNRGAAVFPEIISEKTTDPEFYFKTIAVRGKTVAAVCAGQPYEEEVLNFLVASLERAIEMFGLKLRAPAPKTAVAGETTVAAAVSSAQAPAQPVPQADDAATSDDEQKTQAEARRTARLLISEIKLYHEQELRQGRERSDIYERLQKEIDQGRALYNQRVPIPVLASRDYFHEELVRILTENEPSRLGEAYPGPIINS